MRLAVGDSVKTGKNTAAYLRIDDDKNLRLSASTTVELVKASASKILLRIVEGEMYSNIQHKLSNDEDMAFEAGGTTMSIRGTSLNIGYSKTAGMTLIVTDGHVAVAPTGSNEEPTMVNGGQMTSVAKGEENKTVAVDNYKLSDLPQNILVAMKEDEQLQKRVIASYAETNNLSEKEVTQTLTTTLKEVKNYDFNEKVVTPATVKVIAEEAKKEETAKTETKTTETVKTEVKTETKKEEAKAESKVEVAPVKVEIKEAVEAVTTKPDTKVAETSTSVKEKTSEVTNKEDKSSNDNSKNNLEESKKKIEEEIERVRVKSLKDAKRVTEVQLSKLDALVKSITRSNDFKDNSKELENQIANVRDAYNAYTVLLIADDENELSNVPNVIINARNAYATAANEAAEKAKKEALAKAEAEKKAAEKKARAEKEAAEKAEAEKKAAEEKARAEKEAAEKAEAEKKAAEEAAKKAEEERLAKEKEEAAKKAEEERLAKEKEEADKKAAEEAKNAAENKARDDLNKANAVASKISAIGTVAYNDGTKAHLDDARNEYNKLTDDQKELVSNYKTLTDAETTYAELKAEAEEKAKQDKIDQERGFRLGADENTVNVFGKNVSRSTLHDFLKANGIKTIIFEEGSSLEGNSLVDVFKGLGSIDFIDMKNIQLNRIDQYSFNGTYVKKMTLPNLKAGDAYWLEGYWEFEDHKSLVVDFPSWIANHLGYSRIKSDFNGKTIIRVN